MSRNNKNCYKVHGQGEKCIDEAGSDHAFSTASGIPRLVANLGCVTQRLWAVVQDLA